MTNHTVGRSMAAEPRAQPFPSAGRGTRRALVVLYSVLISANIGAWLWAAAAFRHYPVLFGAALLAYGLGLRHAIDADHIAAIDNVTRRLMQSGQRPVATGFFFSMGHSTVVVLASAAIAATAVALDTRLASLRSAGALIGTLVSAGFLLAIAVMNLFVLAGVYRTFHRVRAGGRYVEEDLDTLLAGGGVIARVFRPLFGVVRKSWHMYPLGLLFGMGFDTATEIALLGLSAAEAAHGMSIWSIMVFPALFTAGMSLVDTTDGVLMIGAYGWAFAKPVRKLYYNLTITFVSVLVALLVGAIETLGLVAGRLRPIGGFWLLVQELNANFGTLGAAIISLFVATWLVSAAVYKIKGYDTVVVAPAVE
jgi:high-affinity nickel-transport protein